MIYDLSPVNYNGFVCLTMFINILLFYLEPSHSKKMVWTAHNIYSKTSFCLGRKLYEFLGDI